jgi:hypothetical protein
MLEKYNHTQIGYLIIYVLGGSLMLMIFMMSKIEFDWVASLVFTIVALSLFLFYKLTVIIRDRIIEIKFGLGLIKRTFKIDDIKSCRSVKTPWFWGWGIRLIPKGWMFNVSGFSSVELTMKNGSVYRIGTDEPEILEKYIQESINR